MSKDKPYPTDRAAGPWNPAWWTEERRKAARDRWTPKMRAAASEYRKAHPHGPRNPAWWTPARVAESVARMEAGRAAAKARRQAKVAE